MARWWKNADRRFRERPGLAGLSFGAFSGPAGLLCPIRREYAHSIVARAIAELHMQRLYFLAAAIVIVSFQAGIALPQNAPDSGTTTTAAPAAAAAGSAAAPAATTTPPPGDKPAATTATAPAEKPASTTTDTGTGKSAEPKNEPKKKKTATSSGKTDRKELDRSIDTGTVPSRYKRQIPQEYHGYIPWGR